MTPQGAPVIARVDTASFEAVRPQLFGIAFRSLEARRAERHESAHARRETSIDPWHPEPVDVRADPTHEEGRP
jgi:hypothetical protein